MPTFSWSEYENRLSRIAEWCSVENVHLEGRGYRLCEYGEVIRTLVEVSSIQVIFLLEQRLQERSSNQSGSGFGSRRTEGISMDTSTPNCFPSFFFTLILFAQLPTTCMSDGGSNATVHFVSWVGWGSANGTAIPLFDSARAATRGCCGWIGGSDKRCERRARRNWSRDALRDSLGLTLGSSASICVDSQEEKT